MCKFEQRKQDHIRLALDPSNQTLGQSGLDTLVLHHEALPDLNFSDIDLTIQSLGTQVPLPFFVSAMTAGHQGAIPINQHLAMACEQTGWAMAVGSQRRQLTDPGAAQEWQTLRRMAPTVSFFGNIGIAQVITHPTRAIAQCAESLNATAMVIHANPLQEALQPEGTPNFKGCYDAIKALCRALPIPVIIKETGCGFGPKTLERLMSLGVAVVDVSGLGGTHWGRIEGHRSTPRSQQAQAAHTFKDWGIDTVSALKSAMALNAPFEVWGSGGVRSGLDAAKLLSLGAKRIGFAKPLLQPALESVDALIQIMQLFEYELKVALFCTGASTIKQLQDQHYAP